MALIMGACSSDDNEIQEQPAQQAGKIHFEATIGPANGGATRTVISEGTGDDAGKLTVAWKGGEEIALVHNGTKDVVTVSVPNADGTATISGDITALASDKEAVKLVYPADAVKSVGEGTSFTANTSEAFLAPAFAQDGTLDYIGTNNMDGREGDGCLVMSGTKATLDDNVDMVSKTAIWELNLTTDGTTPIAAKTVTLKLGDTKIAGGIVTTTTGKSQWFICVVPKTISMIYTASAISNASTTFTIVVSDGTNAYGYAKSSALNLENGMYYKSTLTMTKLVTGHALSSSTVGEVVGTDGLAYAVADKDNLPHGVTAAGMVAYKNGSNGLVIALKDEDSKMNWSTAKGESGAAAHTPTVAGQTWKLPSEDEWKQMFKANGGNESRYTTLNNTIANAGGKALLEDPYWSSKKVDDDYARAVTLSVGTATFYNETKGCSDRVRACFAFISYPVALSAVTSDYVGSVITTDGNVYATVSDATAASETAVAMIAYVGNESDCTHGLAIALEDMSTNTLTWNNSGENNDSKTAAEWCSAWNTSKAVTGGIWRLPTAYDWQRMFIDCGSTSTYVASLNNSHDGMEFNCNGFNSKLSTAGGTPFSLANRYWSSTNFGSEDSWNYYFGDSKFRWSSVTSPQCVRAVLAF